MSRDLYLLCRDGERSELALALAELIGPWPERFPAVLPAFDLARRDRQLAKEAPPGTAGFFRITSSGSWVTVFVDGHAQPIGLAAWRGGPIDGTWPGREIAHMDSVVARALFERIRLMRKGKTNQTVRQTVSEQATLEGAGLRFDPLSRRVRGPGVDSRLEPTKCKLLIILMRSAGSVVPGATMQDEVWGSGCRPARGFQRHIAELGRVLGPDRLERDGPDGYKLVDTKR